MNPIWWIILGLAVIAALTIGAWALYKQRHASVKVTPTPEQRAAAAAFEREMLRASLQRSDPLPPPASLKGIPPKPPADDGVDWPALERLYLNPVQDALVCPLLEPRPTEFIDHALQAATLASIADMPEGRAVARILPSIGPEGREFTVYVRGELMGYAAPEANRTLYAIFNEGVGYFAWVRVRRDAEGELKSDLLFYS